MKIKKDAVKIADTIDDAVFRTLCDAVGCVDEDNDNSDDEESGGESADLANLTLLDDDSDSEDESEIDTVSSLSDFSPLKKRIFSITICSFWPPVDQEAFWTIFPGCGLE